MRSLLEPCGSWHVTQALATGACSHRYGPRFSAWQLVQDSSTVVPTFSSFTLVDPCTLWHEAQSIFPSRSGMWFMRFVLLVTFLWHVAHCAIVLEAFISFGPFAACTLWQLTQPTLRWSC